MKKALFLLILLSFLSCSRKEHITSPKGLIATAQPSLKTQSNELYKTKSIEGDFDGDGKREKLIEFVCDSIGNPTSLDSVPEFEEWSDYIDYIFRKGMNTRIFIKDKKADTLYLGMSTGVFCLINIGDSNKDKKDEIALVKALPDYSRINTCRIYSLCNNKWKELASFAVHEGAFDYSTNEEPVYKEIEGFLKFHDGKWLYSDYHENDLNLETKVNQMKKLIIPKCK